MKHILIFLAIASLLLPLPHAAQACAIFTVVRDGQVWMGNNEDYILPGVIWFIPGKRDRLGRVNVGFKTDFAQGSMNEKGLCFDGAAVAEVPWEADESKPSPKNLVEEVMNECATVAEVIERFREKNCRQLANGQIMFADATGDSAVIAWLPGKGLSIQRGNGADQVVTNTRLEASGYRGQRFVRAEQILAQQKGAGLDTVVAVMDGIHQRGPGAFTSYSTAYDLKNRKVYLYQLADYEHVVEFDVLAELAKKPKKYVIADLFDSGTILEDVKAGEQRQEWDTRVTLDTETLDRYTGVYTPDIASGVQFSIKRDGDELRVINPGQPDAILYAESETLFRLKPDRGQVSFQLDASGEVMGLTLHKQVDLVAKRVQ